MLYAWYRKFSLGTPISPAPQKIKLPNSKSNSMERTHTSKRFLKKSLMGKQITYNLMFFLLVYMRFRFEQICRRKVHDETTVEYQ